VGLTSGLSSAILAFNFDNKEISNTANSFTLIGTTLGLVSEATKELFLEPQLKELEGDLELQAQILIPTSHSHQS
jgi:hypothetical protein